MPHGWVSGCMKKATKLMSIVSGHKGTSPTFEMVAMVMRLSKDVEDNGNNFRGYDGVFSTTRRDVLHRKTSGTIVEKVLSKSKEFLDRLSDVDGIFRRSKASCSGLAGGILDFVGRHRGAAVSPVQIRKIERMREALMSKTSSMKGAWDDLIQCSLNYDDTTVFHQISGIVWTAEDVADKALFASEDFLQSLQRGGCVVDGGTSDIVDNVLGVDVGVETQDDTEVPGNNALLGQRAVSK